MNRLLLPLLMMTLLVLSYSCVMLKGWASVEDFHKFPYERIAKSQDPFSLTEDIGAIQLPENLTINRSYLPFEQAIEEAGTHAFLILKNDTLVYEQYFEGKTQASLLTSFSIAKSVVSALVGIAIDEGHIKGIDDFVVQYVPELNKEEFDSLKIRHLLDMNSGIKFREDNYSSLALARIYHGTDIKRWIPTLKRESEPGTSFYYDYKSINTQLLGIVLERATGLSLSQYLQEKLWEPLGAKHEATWSLDSEEHRTEKAFCCLQASARDFALFGAMYANLGHWNGKQIVPRSWIERNTEELWKAWIDMKFSYNNAWPRNHWYSYLTLDKMVDTDTSQLQKPLKIVSLTWDASTEKEVSTPISYVASPSLIGLLAIGHLGQYIYVIPHKKLVFVRLGKREGKIAWQQLFERISDMN